MFIDQEWKKESKENKPSDGYFYKEPSKSPVFKYAVFIFILVIIFAIFVYLKFFADPKRIIPVQPAGNTETATTSISKLPGEYGNGNGNGFGWNATSTDIRAEYLTFGYFYKKPEDGFTPSADTYELPINVKEDVSNYYDVSRKINLDPYIDDLNKYGFAMVDNQFGEDADDFYSSYRMLFQKQIPVVITDDFLMYYYHNYLNQVFKEIEKTVFYEALWNINKKLFDIALTRYKKRYTEVGMTNDTVLEGARLELAFYATALKLLMPLKDQVNNKPNLVDYNKFSQQEMEQYTFLMPEYLEEDVLKEVEMVRKGEKTAKSPVMLYETDYTKFFVPESYKENAKLNNFYLTLKWLNSVFPLYYISEGCPDCLLDYDDWSINMVAANFITEDVFENKDIKNQWAVIYKFISFFSGLRQDLTYLHYMEAMDDIFGKERKIENLFSPKNDNQRDNLLALQKRLSEYRFSPLEGSFDRIGGEDRPRLGMRMLQESYWPNDYIFDELTGPEIKIKARSIKDEQSFTACPKRDEPSTFYRCRTFGWDIVNLIHPERDKIEGAYYWKNINYDNYDTRMDELRKLVGDFNIYAWNNNIYWVTLDTSRLILEYDRGAYPVYVRTEKWRNEKDVNTIMGSWVNLHLDEDKLVNYYEQKDSSLGSFVPDNPYNYIEPNEKFIGELVAKGNMLMDMLSVLGVTKKTNAASIQLKDLINRLDTILNIAKKELEGAELDNDDKGFINDFAKAYFVKEEREKKFVVNFPGYGALTESIDGIKLVCLVYKKGDKLIMAIGPVFNYFEN